MDPVTTDVILVSRYQISRGVTKWQYLTDWNSWAPCCFWLSSTLMWGSNAAQKYPEYIIFYPFHISHRQCKSTQSACGCQRRAPIVCLTTWARGPEGKCIFLYLSLNAVRFLRSYLTWSPKTTVRMGVGDGKRTARVVSFCWVGFSVAWKDEFDNMECHDISDQPHIHRLSDLRSLPQWRPDAGANCSFRSRNMTLMGFPL